MSVISGSFGHLSVAAGEIGDAEPLLSWSCSAMSLCPSIRRRLLEDAVDPRLDLGVDRLLGEQGLAKSIAAIKTNERIGRHPQDRWLRVYGAGCRGKADMWLLFDDAREAEPVRGSIASRSRPSSRESWTKIVPALERIRAGLQVGGMRRVPGL
jgi:hypothetical protein